MYFLLRLVPFQWEAFFPPELHLPWLCRLCPLLSDHTASQEAAGSLLTPCQAPASCRHHQRSRCCSQPGKFRKRWGDRGSPHCGVGCGTEGGQESALGCPGVAEETRQREEEGSQVTRQDQLSNPSASAWKMLQVKNKAAHAAPVPAEGRWLSEQGSHHCPICQSLLARPRDGTVPRLGD